MHTVSDMVKNNPFAPMMSRDALIQCIEVCVLCEQTCSACADACLGEDDLPVLRRCIRLNLDCADICSTAVKMLSRQQQPEPGVIAGLLELCATICALCAQECGRHHHEHCAVCAEMCSRTEDECQQALAALRRGYRGAAD